MRVAFHDSFWKLFNLPCYISADVHQISYNIITFDSLIRKLLFASIARCQNSSNIYYCKT